MVLYRFDIALENANTLVNDEGTRSFLSVTVGYGVDDAIRLIRAVDKALTAFQLPPYYEVLLDLT